MRQRALGFARCTLVGFPIRAVAEVVKTVGESRCRSKLPASSATPTGKVGVFCELAAAPSQRTPTL